MIQHVTLEVRRDQADACSDFFELLGFRRVDPPATLADRAAWLEAARTQVHLMYVDVPVVPPHAHIAVVLDEYERTLDALREAGHAPEARAPHWGSPRAYVRDPAGHLVELMAAAPPQRP